ncbi:MAG: C39 family peptidase [Pseudanabaenaceae cyanobacterium]
MSIEAQPYRWQLPAVSPQRDPWSCAPNSATRLLRFYGHLVTYPQVKVLTLQHLSQPLTGTPPRVLQRVLQHWEQQRVRLQHQASLPELQALLRKGQPALALVQVGQRYSLPLLHWVTVTGYDPQKQLIFYTDTDDRAYAMSYAQFQRQWQLSPTSDPVWLILRSQGVYPNTVIWIER